METARRSLTLAQQQIVLRHPTEINIHLETTQAVDQARKDFLAHQTSPFLPNGQFKCKLCPIEICQCLEPKCLPIRWLQQRKVPLPKSAGLPEFRAKTLLGGKLVPADKPEEDGCVACGLSVRAGPCSCASNSGHCNPCDCIDETSPATVWPNSLEYVVGLLSLDLDDLPIEVKHRLEVRLALARFGLVASSHVRWIPQRVLTIRQQQLMECHLTDVGINQRTAEKLEEYAKIINLKGLLLLTWDDVCKFARPANQGGIPNFGPKALDEIRGCLVAHKFNAPAGTEWILEQHTKAYLRQEMSKFVQGGDGAFRTVAGT